MSQANSGEQRTVVRFGDFVMDPNRGILSHRGAIIKLQPQPFSVLQILLSSAPNVVTREALGDSIWGSDVFVDLDQSLNYCIRQIRLALGDTATGPKFIETLPKQGYRFIYPITPEEVLAQPELLVGRNASTEAVNAAEAPVDLQADESPTHFSRRTFAWLAGAAMAAAGAGVWIKQATSRRKPPGTMHVVLPLPDQAAASDPSRLLGPPVISPDGTMVAVSLLKGTSFQIYMRRLDSTQFVPVEGAEDGRQPFWSPDSQHIGFFANAKLKRVPSIGGSPKTLCDASDARGGSWGSQGKIIFGINQQAIFQIAEGGGQPRLVTHLDVSLHENSHRNPVFLPDGNRFLYFSRTDDLEKRSVWIESLDGREKRRQILVCDGMFAIGKDPATSYFLLSQQGGKLVAQQFDIDRAQLRGASRILLTRASAFSLSDTGVMVMRTDQPASSHLVWSDRSGKRGTTLGPEGDYWGIDIAPNDRFVAANRHDSINGHFRLWLITLATQLLEPFSESDHASNAIWAPDSNSIFYGDLRSHTLLYRTVSPRSKETVFLTPHESGLYITSLSRDQRFVVGEVASSTAHSEVGWAELQPGQQALGPWHATGDKGPFAMLPRLSPNGRWLAYASDQSGSLELYLMDFPNGLQHRRVSLDGGSMPRWRGDSLELFFMAGDGNLMALPLSASQKWTDTVPAKLFFGNLRIGSYESLYDVTSDGQRFLLIERVNRPDDSYLEMIVNWPSLFNID